MKHTIKSDGAPYDHNRQPINEGKSTAGYGRALCSCGELSDYHATRAARKQWHLSHRLLAEQAENEENTVTDQPIEDLPNDDHEIEVVDTPAEETGLNGDDRPTVTVGGYPEKKLLPAYFFGSIIRLGLAPALDGHAAVESHSERDLAVVLRGEQETLEEVEELVKGIYETLPPELATFKKEFKPKAEGKEGHKESWIARRDFCVDFTRGFAEEFFQEADEGGSPAYRAGVAACDSTFAVEDDEDDTLI